MKLSLSKTMVLSLLIIFLLMGCAQKGVLGQTVSNETFEISIGYSVAPGSFVDLAAKEFVIIAKEKSDGRLVVKTFPSSQLGGERALIDAMQMGSVEMSIPGATMISAAAKDYSLLSGYFLFKSQETLRKFLDSPFGEAMNEDVLKNKGVRVLGVGNRGPRSMTSKREIKSLSDLKGLKIRAPEQPIYIDSWKAMGAIPVPMPFSEVFTALQQNTVDAQENPIDLALSSSFYEVQDYLILTKHQRTVFWWTVSEKFYSKLPDDLKSILQESVTEATKYQDKIQAEQEQNIIEQLKEKGMTIIEPDISAFKDAVQPVLEKYSKIGRTDIYDYIKSLN